MLEGWYFGEWSSCATSSERKSSIELVEDILPTPISVKYTSPRSQLVERKKDDLEIRTQSLKVGMFLTTFMYFRALYILKNQKATWSGKSDSKIAISSERRAMMEQSINTSARDKLYHKFSEKAKSGEELIRERKEKERALAVREFAGVFMTFSLLLEHLV